MPNILSFDKVRIHFVRHDGTKGSLIFVHGWPHNHTVWKREIKYFSRKGYCTIALDLRGHGLSGKPAEISAYKIENFAKDIKQIVIKNKIKNPILIGHSFGGMVLLKFQEMYPKLAKSIILIDSSYENPLKDVPIIRSLPLTSLTKHLLDYILNHNHVQKKYHKEIDFSKFKGHSDIFNWIKGAKNSQLNSLLSCLKDMLDFDEEIILSKINIPCLLIQGEKDFIIPKEVSVDLHRKIRKSQLCYVKNATHDSNLRNPLEINKIIEQFLVKCQYD